MTNKLLFLLFGISLFGCKSTNYVQIIETKADDVKIVDETYVFENDSLIITYDFWRERGLMQFNIYNKLNVPLYIDWRKSSYIDNGFKLNYWEDVERTSALYTSYYFFDLPYNVTTSVGNSGTKMIKDERITFIPPKANYRRAKFYIIPRSFIALDKNGPYIEIPLNNDSEKTTKIFYKEYSKEATPRTFRNFLTFSLTEDFSDEFYIDNEFYISKILEMESGNFYGIRPRYTRPTYKTEELPYMDNRFFYINVGERKGEPKAKKVTKVDFDN